MNLLKIIRRGKHLKIVSVQQQTQRLKTLRHIHIQHVKGNIKPVDDPHSKITRKIHRRTLTNIHLDTYIVVEYTYIDLFVGIIKDVVKVNIDNITLVDVVYSRDELVRGDQRVGIHF